MLNGFDFAGSRDRSGHEGNPDRLKRLWRQSLDRQPCPKTVPIAGDGGEPGNAVIANEVVDFASLDVGAAVITAAEPCIRGSRPWLGELRRKILRIRPHVECSGSVTPYLPCST